MNTVPETLVLIAGKADYPLLLARAARAQGVKHIAAVAFRGETRREIEQVADTVTWLHVGQLAAFLAALKSSGARHVVMAGQISPKNIFTVRMDSPMLALLKSLKVKNAHTVFGAIIEEIEKAGLELLSAGSFMQDFMPAEGLLTERIPTEQERNDIELGRRILKGISEYDIGQTIVIKDGIVLAVEAFEGTDKAIRRGGKLGGHGAVVVKVPKAGHDMRFDIPVIGEKTLKSIKKAKASCLAIEAGGAILLNKEKLIAQADALGLSWIVLENRSSAPFLKSVKCSGLSSGGNLCPPY